MIVDQSEGPLTLPGLHHMVRDRGTAIAASQNKQMMCYNGGWQCGTHTHTYTMDTHTTPTHSVYSVAIAIGLMIVIKSTILYNELNEF